MIHSSQLARSRRFATCLLAGIVGVMLWLAAPVRAAEESSAGPDRASASTSSSPADLSGVSEGEPEPPIAPLAAPSAIPHAPVSAMGAVPDPFPDPIRRSAPHLRDNEHFTIDPVVDGVLVVGGITFSSLLTRILGTGEIRPQAPGNPDKLLSIDRGAVTQTIDPNAAGRSTIGLYAAYGYAILDPILSGARDGRRAFLVDAIMYSEAIALTQDFTLATKIGVRRPRPIDYVKCSGAGAGASATECSDTDLQLSFFSGHASTTGTITGVATYLAFVRSPHSARPWITLLVGTAVTAFVSYERVRSGEHFPTDVIMGSLAGGAIGVLVAHFHRLPHYHDRELEAPPLLIGYAPNAHGGGSLNLQYRF